MSKVPLTLRAGIMLSGTGIVIAVVAAISTVTVPSDANALTSNGKAAQPARAEVASRSDLLRIGFEVTQLRAEIRELRVANDRLRNEVGELTRADGVLDGVIRHIRRIDGEAVVLRGELAVLFGQGADDDGASPPSAVAAYTTPGVQRAAARHQLVTQAAGQPPAVTARMSGVPIPTQRPAPSQGVEPRDAEVTE